MNNPDLQVFQDYEMAPIREALPIILDKLTPSKGEQLTKLEYDKLLKTLYWQIRAGSLNEVKKTMSPAIEKGLVSVWEHAIESDTSNERIIPVIASLLSLTNISGIIRHWIQKEYGDINISTEKITVEPHPPQSANTLSAESTLFACDDKIPFLIKYRASTPVEAMNKAEYLINLDKLQPLLIDEYYPRGRMGVVSITDRHKIGYSNVPIAGSSADSRGIILPDQLYTSGANDMFHWSVIPGVDYRIGEIINHFRHYQITGEDLTAKNELT